MFLSRFQVSSVELEKVCKESHRSVVECAAIGVPPPEGGPERLVIFVVLQDQSVPVNEIKIKMGKALKTKMNPLFKLEDVITLPALPRNATNKVMRRILRDTAKMREASSLKSRL